MVALIVTTTITLARLSSQLIFYMYEGNIETVPGNRICFTPLSTKLMKLRFGKEILQTGYWGTASCSTEIYHEL